MGLLYVLGMEGTTLLKIGHTTGDPEKRLRALQTGVPFRLKILKTYSSPDSASLESAVHNILRDKHYDREWFSLDDIEAIDEAVTHAQASVDRINAPTTHEGRVRLGIGERVRLRRRALGVTQQALAKTCGFPYQVISGLERGRQSIYAERLEVLARALDVSADYLLGIQSQERCHVA